MTIEKKIEFYNDQLQFFHGNEISEKTERAKKYIEESKKVQLFVTKTSIPLMLCTATGGVVGATIGGAISGGPGAVPGCIGGCVIGFTIGSIISADQIRIDYIAWKRAQRDKKVFQELKNFNSENEKLRDFECPLSLELFEHPVRTIYGQTYEKKFIVKHIKNTLHIDNNDPKKNGHLTLKDIGDDYAMLARMAKAFSEVCQDESQLEGLSKAAILGLQAISRDKQRQVQIYIENGLKYVAENYKNKKITLLQYSEIVKDLSNHFE